MKKPSDQTLLIEIKSKVEVERKATADILKLLREVEKRKLYLKLGYSSLFKFCTDELGYNEASAQRRISAMRLISEVRLQAIDVAREIERKLKTGALNLSHLSITQKAYRAPQKTREKIEFLNQIEQKSTREAEKKAALILGREGATRPVHLKIETIELLERFIALTAHKNPGADFDLGLRQALQIAIAQTDPLINPPKRVGYCAGTARAPGKNLRSKIWSKNGGKCAYRSPLSGKICGSRFKLELDHKIPYSVGGKTHSDNLQLLCRAHNQLKSDQ